MKEKMSKHDKIIFTAILMLVSAVAFYIRTLGFPFLTTDMEVCLIPWSAEMPAGQGISVLKNYSGDYNMTYITVLWLLNYLPGSTMVKVKLFSILFDYACAVAAGFLTVLIRKEKSQVPNASFDYRWFLAGFSLILLNPLAIFNSAFWGQCDAVYTAFVLWALVCTIEKKERTAHILMGIAFAFKLQTVSALPFFLILYWVRKRFSLFKLLWIPIMMMVMDIPAYLAGYSIFTPFRIYLKQIRTNGVLYFFYPNVWAMFKECENYMFHSAGVMVTMALLAAMVVFLVRRKIEPSWTEWIGIMVWASATMMEFLPGMHDRYGYILETATLLYILAKPKRFWIAFGVFYAGAMGYFNITLQRNWNEEAAVVAGLLVYALFTGVLVRDLAADSRPEAEETPEPIHVAKNGAGFLMSRFDLGVIRTVNKCIPVLVLAAGILACILVRKPMINYYAPDGFGNFPGNELNLHTGFYNALMSLVQAILPTKPIQFKIKLLSMVGDALAAALLWSFLKRKHAAAACIAFLLWSVLPLNILNGALWGHVDGLSLSLILLGACIHTAGRKGKAGAVIPAILWAAAAALEPRYLLLPVLYVLANLMGKRSEIARKTTGMSAETNPAVQAAAFLTALILFHLTGLLAGMDLGAILSGVFSVTAHLTLLLYVAAALLFAACFADIRFVLPFMLLQTGLLMIWGSYLCGRTVWGIPIAAAECILALVLGTVYALRLFRKDRRERT